MKLGSLFDGSGGFPLAGALNGITPAWAAEIEPYPIAVTRSRFPGMRHYGNVCDINGAEIEPVDIITAGSPCQDMSIAGLRAGIYEGKRSNLFFESIRIVKEMRKATNGKYPRFFVWENVPGAFSSDKGGAFQAVLQAVCSVADAGVSIPQPQCDDGSNKSVWRAAGSIVGNGYSVAWRTFDAQYWGVPQRRSRIYLVADFDSERAAEILFKPQGLRGDMQQGDAKGEEAAADAVRCADGGDGVICLNDQGGSVMSVTRNLIATLRAQEHGHQSCIVQAAADAMGCVDGGDGCIDTLVFNEAQITSPTNGNNPQWNEPCHTLAATDNRAPTVIIRENEPVIALQANGIDRADTAGCNGCGWRENECYTLNTIDRHAVCYGIDHVITTGANCTAKGSCVYEDIQATLKAGGVHAVAYSFDSLASNSMKSKNPISGCREVEIAKCLDTSDGSPSKNRGGIAVVDCYQDQVGCLQARDYKGVGNQYVDEGKVVCYDARGNRYYTRQRSDEFAECDVASCQSARQYKDATDLIISPGKPPRRYIIRRLMPVECARLQGFPDAHGELAPYDGDDTFWEGVRKTHAEINGKKYKPLKNIKGWYEKLHNDGAEYKMWGNGIALPCAEYVIRMIKEEV